MTTTINIATNFSRYPGGRLRTDGPWNGEQFRDDMLVPALNSNDSVVVVIDGDVAGLPPSFLDEAFGGLVRKGYDPLRLREQLKIVATTERFARYPALIWTYINNAGGTVTHAG